MFNHSRSKSEELIDNEPLHSHINKFHDHHRLYIAAFDAWKSNDLSRLITVLSHSYHELRLTQATVLANATQEDRELREDEILWNNEINKQCNSIRNKIEKIGGKEATDQLDTVPVDIEEEGEVTGEVTGGVTGGVEIELTTRVTGEVTGLKSSHPQIINLDSIIKEVKESEEEKKQWHVNIGMSLQKDY